MVCFKLRLATFYVHKVSLLAYKQTFLDSSVTRWNDKVMGVIQVTFFVIQVALFLSSQCLTLGSRKKNGVMKVASLLSSQSGIQDTTLVINI
ncbi:MAG: hypothetical protein LKM43_00880 [Wolbachia endosymbiont of Penenirmus auritus]|nr:hypothetical protein [Wolbachia endosymbiont of Penenirmus auritus]